jgi:hypothetical protein
MKTFVISTIIFLTGIFYTSSQAQSTILDGKTFHIKLTLVEGKKSAGLVWTEDELSFSKGNLNSKFMSKREQFPSAHCEIKVDSTSVEKTISFSASHKNRGVSDIKWEGKVTGNKVEGTAVWTNMQGPRTYSFTGTLKR